MDGRDDGVHTVVAEDDNIKHGQHRPQTTEGDEVEAAGWEISGIAVDDKCCRRFNRGQWMVVLNLRTTKFPGRAEGGPGGDGSSIPQVQQEHLEQTEADQRSEQEDERRDQEVVHVMGNRGRRYAIYLGDVPENDPNDVIDGKR